MSRDWSPPHTKASTEWTVSKLAAEWAPLVDSAARTRWAALPSSPRSAATARAVALGACATCSRRTLSSAHREVVEAAEARGLRARLVRRAAVTGGGRRAG